jgi:FlaG/FlaF family flagellin (archaellin)
VVASELAPLSSSSLPEIPAGELEPDSVKNTGTTEAADHDAAALARAEVPGGTEPAVRVSKLGGAVLLGAVAAAIIAAILIFVVFGVGGATSHKTPTAKKPVATTSTGSSAKPLAQINLVSPTHSKSVGIAEVIKAGNATGVVIVAQGLKANANGDAYAIWLYNSPSSSYRLGYVRPGVTSTGRLQTAGRLPANASRYKHIVVALQHGPSSKPGTIVLEGNLSGV